MNGRCWVLSGGVQNCKFPIHSKWCQALSGCFQNSFKCSRRGRTGIGFRMDGQIADIKWGVVGRCLEIVENC